METPKNSENQTEKGILSPKKVLKNALKNDKSKPRVHIQGL